MSALSPAEFTKLLADYGNAEFECGEVDADTDEFKSAMALSARLETQLASAYDALKRQNGELVSALDPSFLHWILARLIHVHGESQNADFIITLRDLIEKQRLALSRSRGAV